MAVNCNIWNVKRSSGNCTPTLAGTGDKIFVFDIERLSSKTVLECGAGGQYGTGFLSAINGKCAVIEIKSNSGQVTSEKGEDADFRQLTGTGIVNHSFDSFMQTDASLAFMNIGVLIPANISDTVSGQYGRYYYVIASQYKKVKYTSNFDSGTTYDSDHGFTITFTVAPVTSACPMVFVPDNVVNSLEGADASEKATNKAYNGSNADASGSLSATKTTLSLTGSGNNTTTLTATPPTGKAVASSSPWSVSPTDGASISGSGTSATFTASKKGTYIVTVTFSDDSKATVTITVND